MSDISERVWSALKASIDDKAFSARLAELVPESAPASAPASSPPPPPKHAHVPGKSVSNELLEKWSLADVLDESILHANPSDKPYPLRLLFAEMSANMAESDEALTFAAAANLYFRTECDEEARVTLGIEVSRAFYTFARTLDASLLPRAAPSFAALLSTQLERTKLESVDHLTAFDSNLHERDRGASAGGTIREVRTFACRIVASGMVRAKARVMT
jgi:hypothetical protein